MYYLDSGLCFGGLNPIGENRFSFFFFFFSICCGWEKEAAVGKGGFGADVGANLGACEGGNGGGGPGGSGGCAGEAAGGVALELGVVFPHLKFNHELTLPCLDSSQFLANSFSTFLFSSASNSDSRFRAASSEILCSN